MNARRVRLSFVGLLCVLSGLAAWCTWSGPRSAGIAVAADRGAAAQPTAGKEWPLFRGNSLSTGIAESGLPDEPDLLWEHRVKGGAFEGTAVISEGTAYIGDLDGKLYALDLAVGQVRWSYETPNKDAFMASPAVRDGRLFIGDTAGRFYCFEAKGGKPLWGFSAEAEIDSAANFHGANVLFGSQDATLYCLNAADGTLVWKYAIQDQIRCAPTIVEDRCFVAGCDGNLHIIDLTSGKSVADVPIDSPTMSTPAIRGNFAYFGTEAGTFFCVDWREAKVVWKFESAKGGRGIRSSAAVTDDLVVFGSRSRRVHALRLAGGEEAWSLVTKQNVDSSPVIVGDRAFVGASDRRLYAINMKTGKKTWEFEAGGEFTASPAVADGKLVIASTDGVVYCFGKKQ